MDLTKAYVIDIETNGLFRDMVDYSSFPYKLKESARIWCVVIQNIGTREVFKAVGSEITQEWIDKCLHDCEYLVAHNGLKFDFLSLKLFNLLEYRVGYLEESDTIFGRNMRFIDTLILSRLFNPDRFGGHSLESWGERVGDHKTDFRQVCIDKGIIDKKSPRGSEFQQYCEDMLEYCVQDTNTTISTFFQLIEEMKGYNKWASAVKMEHKLADLAIRRENFGFFFNKKLALELLADLSAKMTEIEGKINPILPPRKMNKGELEDMTPPKKQINKDGSLSANMVKFLERVGGMHIKEGAKDLLIFEDKVFELPFHEPIKNTVEADITNLDHVKMYLISLGWDPVEWRERDLTKDSKKQNLPYEKRIAALERWFNETMSGKYRKQRIDIVGIKASELMDQLSFKLLSNRPVRVPTSPCVRVGVEKELCPNLVRLGDKVGFAGDFALYLTYKHRKSSIAGGEIEDMDFDEEAPNTGFLSLYREVDGRVPTPAIEIGASTNRYRHIGICNIARSTSVYGKEMRSLFGCGPRGVQFGYDFSSLEARVMGNFVLKYQDGESLAAAMLAEKPNDIHSVNGRKLGIPRSDAKSLTYAILYGSAPAKIAKMLNVSMERAKEIYKEFWDAVPALKELKEALEKHWEANDKKFIRGIDGRKIMTRSQHSLLNALFQSSGIITAKYVNVISMYKLEKLGHTIDPFISEPSVCEMIAYHDECQLFSSPKNITYSLFKSEAEAKEFVSSWNGEGQLSAITEGKSWYVAMPNDISKSIEESIRETEELLHFNVPLGYEWIVSNTWYGCH